MSLQDQYLALKMEFYTLPPPAVYGGDAFPGEVAVRVEQLEPFTLGPGERLDFTCEFIPNGAGPSDHHSTGTYRQIFPSQGRLQVIGFEPRIVPPNPGNYMFQVTAYILREGMDPVALKSISCPIDVFSKAGHRRAI
jgi:hypothetical protein